MKGEKNKELLSLDEISALRNKYIGEPYSIHVSYIDPVSYRKIQLVKWLGNDYTMMASMTIYKADDNLWEVDKVRVFDDEYKGCGKILYYVAMQHIYPAYLTPSGEGVSQDAKRIYDALEQLDYVESQDVFEEWGGLDLWPNEYVLANRMYRFRFPS